MKTFRNIVFVSILLSSFLFITAFTSPPALYSAQDTPGNNSYINWLEKQSMLYEGKQLFRNISGNGSQWQHPYALPQPEKVVHSASAWFTAYPPACITKKGQSVIQVLGDPALWQELNSIGLPAMHTGPLKKAGGIKGHQYTPTVDGWFDRISLHVDPIFGNDDQYKEMVKTAREYNSLIIGDIVPGHTGKGADFRLAERGYQDYPGLYTMIAIDEQDWGLLPPVPDNTDSVNLTTAQVNQLHEKGYLPGRLQRVLFSDPSSGASATGWDATGVITATDGTKRRYVYLHYFRPGQPTLNWLDPSFAANRLIAGDIVNTLTILGAKGLRLDANSFLGIEPVPGSETTWSEGNPLSVVASDQIAMLIRKLNGWSFQELNLAVDAIRDFSQNGPDLAYDFITRPAYVHALLTQDASFLRLTLHLMHDYNIKPVQLIHALQNHDEITYELVHFTTHADNLFPYHGKKISGKDLRDMIIDQMHKLATGPDYPYNKLSGNGLATTYTGVCAAALGIKDINSITPEQKELIKKGHLLMAMYNAMQPGVFALSGWDLVGALPLPEEEIKNLVADGDYRWINRGAYDLSGENPGAVKSASGLPKTQVLYGNITAQLNDPGSFASGIKKMLALRRQYGLATAEQIAVPATTNDSVLIMIHQLPNKQGTEITALNFARNPVQETIKLDDAKGLTAVNLLNNKDEGQVSDANELTVSLGAWEGKILLLKKTEIKLQEKHSEAVL